MTVENKTGVIVGRLSAVELEKLIIDDVNDRELRAKLLHLLKSAYKYQNGLVISEPLELTSPMWTPDKQLQRR